VEEKEQPRLTIDDPDGWRLRVVWSRSGKRAGLSMEKIEGGGEYRQMELRPKQIEELIEFFAATLPEPRRPE
jgi:type II secretory pathway component PulM